MSAATKPQRVGELGKCDAKGCGSPASVTDRLGGRYCTGHAYLAARAAGDPE